MRRSPSPAIRRPWPICEALPANILIAVNMEYKDASAVVHGGDEVAFFPPVTGGGA